MTVEIVVIPLDKQGWNRGDLIDQKSLGFGLGLYDNKSGIDDWQAQQLLVLSDDEIKVNNMAFNPDLNCVFTRIYADIPVKKGCKKIIASYPHIEGTLPVSKKTIQTWIDAGCPNEGSVEMFTLKSDYNQIGRAHV